MCHANTACLTPLLPAYHSLTRATPPVPCLSRASDLERYDPGSEFALAGDDDGWVATHQHPTSDKPAAGAAGDDMPDLDEPASASSQAQQQQQQGQPGTAAAAAVDDDDVPDISDLELVEPEDEVRQQLLAASLSWS
jgi:hypothetical protein